MENILGLIKVRVRRGINLVARDTCSSDPYVLVTMADQKLKSRVVKDNCNPEWNDELTLSIKDLNDPIKLTVYDKDTFSVDDTMGDAEIDIKPYVDCMKMGLEDLPIGTKIDRVQPSQENCLSDESCIVWNQGKITQDMRLRLRNVKSGEVDIQIEWINIPGSKGLSTSGFVGSSESLLQH